jgi:23S rRNA maturation-related 3'-5' exoribonuclease YhaM
MAEAEREGVDRELMEKIGHAILAHHGRIEWETVQEPNTLEAYIVHTADRFSAVYGVTGL